MLAFTRAGFRMTVSPPPTLERQRLLVRGTVQGVGFRPFVWRLAREESLRGWVRNGGQGVEIEVEGGAEHLARFGRRLRAEAPPLARIETVDRFALEPDGAATFEILPSHLASQVVLPISPDVAPCLACRAEVDAPADRRYGYPFTNCTDCGPRFTIIRALPYDRERTTMREFALCRACRREYEDPGDRRFHAEPIACPTCGPRLEFRGSAGVLVDGALDASIAALGAGTIVAVKGLGGFQLSCDAADEAAVARLRERKGREAKPFAVMMANLELARLLCHVGDAEGEVLASPQAPVVLLRIRNPPAPHAPRIAPSIAPGLDTLGVMLPSTPLHHILLRRFGRPLVMTSGNRSEEPIAVDNCEAAERLHTIADAFLFHDRAIASRYDDSVVHVADGEVAVLRRARGYAPSPIRLSRAARVPILGTGAQLKNTFCLVRGADAFLSQHIGDLDDALTLAHHHETLALYRRLFATEPEVVAHDLHPDYATTSWAHSLPGVRIVGVQHHHAHIASCAAEHGVREPVIGVALDGTGYGTDGAAWGGELLVVDGSRFERVAHLQYLPLPGGDAAAREPWRMAVAALVHAFGDEADPLVSMFLPSIPNSRRRAVTRLARGALPVPLTSSAGRLFDAVAALTGVRHMNRYEGQAAMELEARVDPAEDGVYPLPRAEAAGSAVWDVSPLVRAIVDDLRGGTAIGSIAARFHNALAASITESCELARERTGIGVVALSGGCFQNRRLLTTLRERLRSARFHVITHRSVPPNDGGISLGQAAVALAVLDE
jgi:hydrogenase maturation protein HypF